MVVLGLIAIPVLILINGYFVAVEFALVAVRKTRVEELVQQGTRGARSVRSAATVSPACSGDWSPPPL